MSVHTGLFYAKGTWTHDAKLADDFPNKESAEQLLTTLGIRNADLVTVNEEGRVTGGTPIWL